MSPAGAVLFRWVQSAPAYIALHRDAVALLPPGDGRTWLDVGCGPGLVARLAAQHGYRSEGVDLDPAMVRAARRYNSPGSRPTFRLAALDQIDATSDVVSAASLVCQIPDPAGALRLLWNAVAPGGHLLVIETTPTMTPRHVRSLSRGYDRHSRWVLGSWARARSGRAVALEAFHVLPEPSAHMLFLDGAVRVVAIGKPT